MDKEKANAEQTEYRREFPDELRQQFARDGKLPMSLVKQFHDTMLLNEGIEPLTGEPVPKNRTPLVWRPAVEIEDKLSTHLTPVPKLHLDEVITTIKDLKPKQTEPEMNQMTNLTPDDWEATKPKLDVNNPQQPSAPPMYPTLPVRSYSDNDLKRRPSSPAMSHSSASSIESAILEKLKSSDDKLERALESTDKKFEFLLKRSEEDRKRWEEDRKRTEEDRKRWEEDRKKSDERMELALQFLTQQDSSLKRVSNELRQTNEHVNQLDLDLENVQLTSKSIKDSVVKLDAKTELLQVKYETTTNRLDRTEKLIKEILESNPRPQQEVPNNPIVGEHGINDHKDHNLKEQMQNKVRFAEVPNYSTDFQFDEYSLPDDLCFTQPIQSTNQMSCHQSLPNEYTTNMAPVLSGIKLDLPQLKENSPDHAVDRFLTKLTRYFDAHNVSPQHRISLLENRLEGKFYDAYLRVIKTPGATYDSICTSLRKCFATDTNQALSAATLAKRRQLANESIHQYYKELSKLAYEAGYTDQDQSVLITLFIFGLHNEEIQRKCHKAYFANKRGQVNMQTILEIALDEEFVRTGPPKKHNQEYCYRVAESNQKESRKATNEQKQYPNKPYDQQNQTYWRRYQANDKGQYRQNNNDQNRFSNNLFCKFCKSNQHYISNCPERMKLFCNYCRINGHIKERCFKARRDRYQATWNNKTATNGHQDQGNFIGGGTRI